MYLAVWIDDRNDRPHDRIVLVTPLLKRLNAAVALLNSKKREDATSLILSGDQQALNQFAQLVDRADDDWVTENDGQLLDALGVVADKAGCSIVPFDGQDGQVAADVVLAKIKRIPKPGLYPRFITKEGKAIWDEVVVQYKKTLNNYKADKEKMWAAAILIFKRVAGQRDVKPFTKDFGAPHRGKILTETHRRINRGNHKALKAVQKAAELLAKEKLATRLTNEKFYETAHHGGRYYITTYQVLTTVDATRALDLLREKAWGGGAPGYVHRAVDMYTDVLAEPLGKKKLYFYIATHLTSDLMNIMFPSLEDADSQTIMRTLSKAGRQWVKTGTMRAIAAVERSLTIHVSDKKAPHVIRMVLKRLGIDYQFRTRKELLMNDYPRNVGPQFHIETAIPVAELERHIMDDAIRRGIMSLGFEVVD